MKKAIFLILISGIVFSLSCCTQKEAEDNRTLITKKIQYDVPIMNPDASHDWWIRNIEGSDREALIDNIFDRVLSGDIRVYDYFNEPLSVKDVERMMSDTTNAVLQRPYPPYAEYDTTIIYTIDRSDITLLRFLEEWKYDEQSLQIDKKVYAISPVIEMKVNGMMVTRPLFWIYMDEGFLKK
ncbi:MAG: hypothetical protein V2I47_11040 [Bacteroidales bacterium]|jgi:hypothetical protein|nr:hypothetical protein [Bacteroidales bacterium]